MRNMVCDKCGEYYEFQDGESPDDPKKCECGGSLNFVQNIDMHITDELDPLAEITFCPKCGKNNVKTLNECTHCGASLKKKTELEKPQQIKWNYIIYVALISILIIIILLILIYR